MRGRKKKPEGQVKHRVIIFVEKDKIDELTMKECEEISKESINKEYLKRIKAKQV